MKGKYGVEIVECERGWGQKIDDVKWFNTEKEREDFIRDFNKDNTEKAVPDWYMFARKIGSFL